MRISVVIPAYNEEQYLPKTLASIARLTRQPDEVIVVDSFSTDRTQEIARQFGAKVIRAPKSTIGFARQKGLEAATGDIVAETDADTIVPPHWLTIIEQTLTRPGVAGTFGCYVVHDGKLPYRLYITLINPIMFWLFSRFGVYIPGGQNIAFWKNKAIEAGGYPVDFRSLEDYEIVRRLATVGKIVYRTDNTVVSAGRRGKEGWGMIWRVSRGFVRYIFLRKADTFSFPDIR